MPEEAVKKRHGRAVRAVEKALNYPVGTAQVTVLKNHVFHIEAIRKKEIRKIRVVLDEITPFDRKIVSSVQLPENFTREIWCRELNGKFKVIIV